VHTYDVIVVGLGGWGSATLYHLARRRLKVCGIEQFRTGHDRGSSHGDSRVIRMAYFAHPDYVPVLRRAYELWRALEAESGRELMTVNGLLCIGEPDAPLIQGLERCYATHQIDHERLTPEEAMRRHPQFHIAPDLACYWDPFGGFLRPDECVRAHLHGALAAGAHVHEETAIERVEIDGEGVTLHASSGRFRAAKVVLAAGAYTDRLLPSPARTVQAVRKVLFWYGMADPADFAPDRFPVWIAQLRGLNFYGFPTLDGASVKAAEDTGGTPLDEAASSSRMLEPGDEANLAPFMQQLFGGRVRARVGYKTCLYENSSDRHFIVDFHPQSDRLVVAGGGSGHGFKFCSVIGEIAADLAQHGESLHRPPLFHAAGRLDRAPHG